MDLIAAIKRLLTGPADAPGTVWRATWHGMVVAESDRTVVVEATTTSRQTACAASTWNHVAFWQGVRVERAVAAEAGPPQ